MSEHTDTAHEWVSAAIVTHDARTVRVAVSRGHVVLQADTRVETLETYCRLCRRGYRAVSATPCEAKAESTRGHLRGGPPEDVRRKRGPGADNPPPPPRPARRGAWPATPLSARPTATPTGAATLAPTGS